MLSHTGGLGQLQEYEILWRARPAGSARGSRQADSWRLGGSQEPEVSCGRHPCQAGPTWGNMSPIMRSTGYFLHCTVMHGGDA